MDKTIVIKLKKAGGRTSTFSISDDLGNVLGTDVSKEQLIQGIAYSVDDNVNVVIVTYTGTDCCSKTINIPVSTITNQELVDMTFSTENTSSMWKHLTDPTVYNKYYGCIRPYVIEYPLSYEYFDEVAQNVKDYTKAYKYLPNVTGVSDNNRKVQTNTKYFNKAVLYNDQQSSGILELHPKPLHNMKEYISYPKFNSASKSIIFTKSDNFYQYNTFWNIVADPELPLFLTSCESMSIDKEVNQSNMEYGTRSFRKDTLRAKDLKIRHMLDNASDVHLVSQFVIAPAQISYK